tara:strand:+ start:3007 stop:3450 length:444 start_codon:yes stop_codon:yes gene_type:complete
MNISLIGICGECAENIQRHFDIIKDATPIVDDGRCVACNDRSIDMGFKMPKKFYVMGLAGELCPDSHWPVSFKEESIDLSNLATLVERYTNLSQELHNAPYALGLSGHCNISACDETGYSISIAHTVRNLLAWMSKFGKVTRGADNE